LFDVGCSVLVQQTADSRQQAVLFVWLVLIQHTADNRQQTAGGQQSTGAGSSWQTVVKEWQPMKASDTHQDEAGGWPEGRV
jgi:hypothetical protein